MWMRKLFLHCFLQSSVPLHIPYCEHSWHEHMRIHHFYLHAWHASEMNLQCRGQEFKCGWDTHPSRTARLRQVVLQFVKFQTELLRNTAALSSQPGSRANTWFRVARCFWGSWPGTDLETSEVTGSPIEKIKLLWQMQIVCYLLCENTNAKNKQGGRGQKVCTAC